MNEDTDIANAVVQHAQLELETLAHVKAAVSNAIGAEFEDEDLGRKLTNVRFVVGSFQRYIERLFALEEHDGYMPALTESHPHLQRQIEELRTEHNVIRERIRELVVRLETLSATDTADFNQLCDSVAKLISQVDSHTNAETRLLQDTYNLDLGGES